MAKKAKSLKKGKKMQTKTLTKVYWKQSGT